ncbi:hypothetical protein HDV02_000991 [Globomyces sp. JEL0801]|nr:hypothetical protein HDV02_000991 [Globomyces sp. JEL0801]
MGISNVTIPSSDLLVSTISQSNRFFLQIRHLANLFCSVGPYIVTQNFNHISLSKILFFNYYLEIPIEPSSTTTVVVDPLLPTPQAIPTSVAKSSETKGIALWLLAIIVLVSLMVLLMLVYTIYWIATRRRVSTGELASSDSPRPEKHQKDIEHQVDHPNPLGSQINHSTTSLPNPAFFDLTDNSSTVLSTSSEPPKRFISSLSHEDALAMADAFKVALKNPPDEWEEKD